MLNITGIIKSIQNIMRQDKGLNGDAQRIEQLGWMIFLKIFDAKDEEMEFLSDDYISPIPKDLQWRNWASDDEGITGEELLNFIDKRLFPELKTLPSTNRQALLVREVFEGNNNYMKSGTYLRQVINKLNEIDFNQESQRHLFGDIYETILKELQSAGNSGEFYTPRAITKFVTTMVNPKLGDKILDPACGTGGFLTSAIEHIRKDGINSLEQREILQNSTIRGIELKPLPHMLAITNLILHDIEIPDIVYDDALSVEISRISEKDKVDIILANPPFGGNVGEGMETNFPAKYRTKESADLFLVLIIAYLKEQGKAGIVLPDGSLTGDGVKARIREKLLTECNLHTIIRLPNSVFQPYASVATNLLFFTKGEATKKIWYYEHKLPEGQKSYSKTKPIRIEEFEEIKKWWYNREENEQAWQVDIESKIKKAKAEAKPYLDEVSKDEKKLSQYKTKLKSINKKLKEEKTEKLKSQKELLSKQIKELEMRINSNKQQAETIYYGAFDLDIKNPHREEEEVLKSSSEYLELLENSFKKSSELLELLKGELKNG